MTYTYYLKELLEGILFDVPQILKCLFKFNKNFILRMMNDIDFRYKTCFDNYITTLINIKLINE